MKINGLMSKLPNGVSSKIGLTVLKGKKHSPVLLFGAGVVGVVATVVLASKATLKLNDILDEANENLDKVNEARQKVPEKFSERDAKTEQLKIRTVLATDIIKLYGPAVLIGVASVSALAGSHVILTKRNGAIIAAYKALETGFDEYRKRVVNELGEEKDREFRLGAVDREVFDDDEHGGKSTVIKQFDKKAKGNYARLFDEHNKNWQNTPEYNFVFLSAQQKYANHLLNANGYVLLNDVYDALGMERTKAGCVVGWLLDGEGDGYVDFGIWANKEMDQVYDIVVGAEKTILLDFNVDGVIYDKI